MRSSNAGVGLPSLSAGVPRTMMASKLWRLVLARGARVLAAIAHTNKAASNPTHKKEMRTARGNRGRRAVRLRLLFRGIELVLRFVPGNCASIHHSIVMDGDLTKIAIQ